MRACVTKSSIIAVHFVEVKPDVRLVDGDLVSVDGSWCVRVITNAQLTLSYFFETETAALDVYTRLNEPGLNHEFECLEVKH